MRLLLGLLVFLAAQLPAHAGSDDLAIIIANKRYDYAHPVEYADRDGEAMRDVAERVLAIPRERIIVVNDASLARLRTLFGTATRPGEIAGRLAGRKAQRVWIYYSGHGVPGKRADGGFEPYLLPKDANPQQPEHSALALEEIEAAVRAAVAAHAKGAQTVLILDACFSGRSESETAIADARGRVLSPESSAGGPLRFAPRKASDEIIVLAAARDDEIASWDREARHGLFTELLLQAFFNGTGEGRAVTLATIEKFLAARTNERLAALFPAGGRVQRPELRGPRSAVLVDNAGTITRDEGARRQATVLCNGLTYSPDAKAIGDFLASPLCARGCDETCRTALGERRRTLLRESAECMDLAQGLDTLIKAKQPKSVLEAALKDVPQRCVAAREQVAAAIAALEPPPAPPKVVVPDAPPAQKQPAQAKSQPSPAPGLVLPLPVPSIELKLPSLSPAPKAATVEPPPAEGADPALSIVPGSGQSFRDCYDTDPVKNLACPEMVVVPAGSFVMGSSEAEIRKLAQEFKGNWWKAEGPQRKVIFKKSFAVGKFEITFDEWAACAVDGCSHKRPSDQGWGRGRRPVIDVSWSDAKQYVDWLSGRTGRRYRLLSEAEWEYAARAGTTTRYAFGHAITKALANFQADRTVLVGSFVPNAWGLFDMHGNVWEWVEDCWHDTYFGAPTDGSAWVNECREAQRRVVRGGSWFTLPQTVRSADRGEATVGRTRDFGFRVARFIDPS